MSSLILRISVSNKPILQYFSVLSHYFQQKKLENSSLKIDFELFDGGILFIYKDFDFFKEITAKENPVSFSEKKTLIENISPNKKYIFPDCGVKLNFQIINGDINATNHLLIQYFQILHKDIEFKISPENNLIITLLTNEAFISIISDFFYRYSVFA